MRAWMIASLASVAAVSALAQGVHPGGPGRADMGKQVYQKANCVGCHKWHGGGGGGYGGAALSLRATSLDREQIVEIVDCGRPGTGMPYHKRGAYDGTGCYGLSREELGKDIPIEGVTFLRPAEVEAVADYVLTHFKGRGEPTYAECEAFFGAGARACRQYQAAETPEAHQSASQATPQGGPTR